MNTIRWFGMRSSCPGCGCKQFEQLISIPYSDLIMRNYLETFYNRQGFIELSYLEGVDFALGKCSSCDLIFQIYIPNNELMGKLYDEWIEPSKVYDLIDGRHNVEYFLGYSIQIANIIHYFGKKPQELKILDFGMGWGSWCRLARGYDCNVVGHELSVARINHVRGEGIPVIDWDEISQIKFDYINTDQVFEHIPTPLETLKYLAHSLKPKGVLRICVPNSIDVESKLKLFLSGKIGLGAINPIAPLEHINSFKYKSILTMAAQAGLDEVHIPSRYSTVGNFLFERTLQPCLRFIGRRNTDIYLVAN